MPEGAWVSQTILLQKNLFERQNRTKKLENEEVEHTVIGNLFSKKPALEFMRAILNHWPGKVQILLATCTEAS